MKVGIIVYSHTGNTYSVAQKLKDKLAEAGHEVEVERITITGEATPGSKDFTLETRPDTEPYDALIFAAPVQAFSLNPAMTACLEQIASLQGKKIAFYVTKRLPGKWTGGSQAVARMKKICKEKGATVCGSEVIIWNSRREYSIGKALENLVCLF